MNYQRGFLSLAVASLSTLSVLAFDTGHHSDLTRSAMLDFQMNDKAIQVCQVENWLVDYYSNREVGVSDNIINDCAKLHSDNLFNSQMVMTYWHKLSYNAKRAFEEAARNKNPKQVLALLGMSLHAVQDFYSHSNWAEMLNAPAGYDYPTTTLFDARTVEGVHTGKSGSSNDPHPYPEHGGYDNGMNHDWYGRPNWDKAYVLAYSGSRQWVNQVKLWVTAIDPTTWTKAKNLTLTSNESSRLSSDLNAAYRISEWVKYGSDDGHWKGKWTGDRTSFVAFTAHWITLTLDSIFVEDFKNRSYQQLLSGGLRGALDLNNFSPITNFPTIARVPMDRKAVYLRTTSIKDNDDQDSFLGSADMFAKITVSGQTFVEACMQDRGSSNPAWAVIRFVPINDIGSPIKYELYDEDTSYDDHMDINPKDGTTDLTLMFNFSNHRLTGIGVYGIYDTPSRLFSSGDGSGGTVKFYVTAKKLAPTPKKLLIDQVPPTRVIRSGG